MSFGFRKKLNTTPKKLKKLMEGDAGKKKLLSQKVFVAKSNNFNHNESTTLVTNAATQDSNGNNEPLTTNINFKKVSAAAAVRAAASPANAGEANRFGFRGVTAPRPASTGLTSRFTTAEGRENFENNNFSFERSSAGKLVSNLKVRSKSAHVGRTSAGMAMESDTSGPNAKNTEAAAAIPKITQPKSITFNLNQNSTIEYQRQQFFQQSSSSLNGRTPTPTAAQTVQPQQAQHLRPYIINTGMHTNVIVRPTPRIQPVSAYAKFTLQTVSLPKPEFAVPISVNASTPTTPGNTIFNPLPTGSARPHPLTMVHTQSQFMDAKQAKQLVNNTRRSLSGSWKFLLPYLASFLFNCIYMIHQRLY